MLDDIIEFILEIILWSLPAKVLFWLTAIVFIALGLFEYEEDENLAIIFLIIGVSAAIIALLITLFSPKKRRE